MELDPLKFAELRVVNVERSNTAFVHGTLNSWNGMEWACALAGEVGELCNLLKKKIGRRDDSITLDDIAREMADVQTYLDLLAAHMGVDLAKATREKFNEVSDRIGSQLKLPGV